MSASDATARFLKAFGRAVRARRESLELSQEDLGFRAKLHRTYVSDIERGARNPTLRIILSLATALQTKPEKLVAAAQVIVDENR